MLHVTINVKIRFNISTRDSIVGEDVFEIIRTRIVILWIGNYLKILYILVLYLCEN